MQENEEYKGIQMQHTINDINLLPTPTQLRKISQSLAMLDAILMPEWDNRYFSFDSHWDDGNEEMMASMKTGDGDEYYILFNMRNAIGKVYSDAMPKMSSSEISNIEKEASKNETTVSYLIEGFMDEEAFEVSDASFFFWYGSSDKNWTCTQEKGDLDYLKFLLGDATFYKEWAEEYYETYIDLDVVKKIMKHTPLKSSMVETLNPNISMNELSEDIEEIGYPIWKKKGKRKTLPKDFEELLEEGDIEKLKKVFDICELDAYGGYAKHTAIAFDNCPDELVRWLVGKGLDINKLDYYNDTPLSSRAGSWHDISIFLELGADVNLGYPLHNSADAYKLENTKLLLDAGANVNKKNEDGLIPLEYTLQRCENSTLEYIVDIVKLLLEYGSKKTLKMKKFITRLGKNFEFYRGNMNKDSIESISYDESVSSVLDELYALFDVEPVPKRIMHDGKSEIIIKETEWKKQFNELWDMFIPSSGHAATIQGEVIRIAGLIADEVDRNGGANWDKEYRKMGKAYLQYIGRENPLPKDEIEKLKIILSSLDNLYDETDNLIKYAVKWVSQNLMPISLGTTNYNR